MPHKHCFDLLLGKHRRTEFTSFVFFCDFILFLFLLIAASVLRGRKIRLMLRKRTKEKYQQTKIAFVFGRRIKGIVSKYSKQIEEKKREEIVKVLIKRYEEVDDLTEKAFCLFDLSKRSAKLSAWKVMKAVSLFYSTLRKLKEDLLNNHKNEVLLVALFNEIEELAILLSAKQKRLKKKIEARNKKLSSNTNSN